MTETVHVIHVGVIGNTPSGMAQVVNGYLSWSTPGVTQEAIATTRRRRDPLAPALLIRAIALLVSRRLLHRVDTVAVHMSERGSFVREGLVVLIATMLGIRVVAHLHGATFESFAAQRPGLVSAILRRADAVAALTRQSQGIVTRLAPSTPVTLIPNAVSVPPTLSSFRTKTFFFAGEVGERKGADTLLSAWKELGTDRLGWQLQIAGPDKLGLMDTVDALPGLTYLGSLSHADVLTLASTARVVVLPSRREALPMFLLESMARGAMPISTPVGDVRRLVEAVGTLVEPGDVAGLVDALRDVCNGTVDVDDLGRRARGRIEDQYSSERVASVLLALWSGRGAADAEPQAVTRAS